MTGHLVERPLVPWSSVFLTGGTGFLGSFLLVELLRRSRAQVHCLVRARDAGEARGRLRASLERHHIWDEQLSGRLEVVCGDLGLPRFGLSEAEFEALAERVEAVYHSGALVNFAYPYPQLKAANVFGTQEALRLASLGPLKPFHHLSTLRVFYGYAGDAAGVVRETDDLGPEGLRTGYSQTKWVSERLVRIAQSRGLPAAIYRPGMVTGHSRTGVSNPDDLFSRMVKGCIQIGCIADLDVALDLTPVDYVSAALVDISARPDSLGGAFHLVNPQPVPWSVVVDWIRSLGYVLDTVPYDVWRRTLLAALRRSPDNALAPLAAFFRPEMGDEPIPVFDCQGALRALAGTSVACPPADASLLATYCSFFVESGFLAKPSPPPSQRPALAG